MPQLHVNLLNKQLPAFHFWVVSGLIVAMICCAFLAWCTGRSPLLAAVFCWTGFSAIFVVAIIKKIFTGKENLVFYQYYLIILIFLSISIFVSGNDLLHYLDLMCIGITINLAFGRIGCYNVGCCHGAMHSKGVCYSKAHADHGFPKYLVGIPLFPLQLVAFGVNVLLAVLCTVYLITAPTPGAVFCLNVCLYAVGRFILELFRGDADRPYLFNFSEAQWTGFCLLVGLNLLGRSGVFLFSGWLLILTLLIYGVLMIAVHIWRLLSLGKNAAVLLPKHKREVLESLNRWRGTKEQMAVFTTSKGLHLTCSEDSDGTIHHYGLSVSGGQLPSGLVRRIVDFLRLSRHKSDLAKVRVGKNNVSFVQFRNESK